MAERVRVYRNLRTGTLSLQRKVEGKGWRVDSHPHGVYLRDVRFRVSKAGRDRTLRTGQRNVHAFVEGELISPVDMHGARRATYQPFIRGAFYNPASGDSVLAAGTAWVHCHRGIRYR